MAAGSAANPSAISSGGVGGGFPTAFVGSNGEASSCQQYFAGGGGGGGNTGSAGGGALGGGGNTGTFQPGPTPVPGIQNGSPGDTNTGGGGGGPNNATQGLGGAGGSGIVIIRYKFQ